MLDEALAQFEGVERGRVLVAMSGGVDSSVAAALLARAGFDVVGCFMRLGSPGETLEELTPADDACDTPQPGEHKPGKLKIGHQGCCSINDAADARLVAAKLGVPFYVCNFKQDFGRIIDYFVDEYAAGRTPNPCVRCNDWLKFGKLHDYAKQIGARYVASGHYARIRTHDNGPALCRGVDDEKDQSYVLFGMPREQLAETLLPIGSLQKPVVRALAEQFGLPVFNKPDSQEICFVPDQDYAGLVDRRRPELARAGSIVDREGTELGTHQGQHRFTLGQRRGVGVAMGRPIYVIDKDPRTNTVVVGDDAELDRASCTANEANWLTPPPPTGSWIDCLARYRHLGEVVTARVRTIPDTDASTPSGRPGRFEVEFRDAQRAVAPGQAIVLYDPHTPELVLGGGWIAASARPTTSTS